MHYYRMDAASGPKTFHIIITGLVQGVGFRPFIYRIAHELDVKGEVENRTNGVYLTVTCIV